MQISPPFGYREVVPFLKTQKVRLLSPGEVPPFVQQGNAVPISHTEFQPIARHYPIVFTSGDAGKSFAAVAASLFQSGVCDPTSRVAPRSARGRARLILRARRVAASAAASAGVATISMWC